jgi:hypothetical protein
MSFGKIFRFLILFVLCISSVAASAQKFSLGLKAGVLGAYTNFAGAKDTLKSGVKLGFNVGGLISFPLKKKYSFVAEGGFSQQGRNYKSKLHQDTWNNTYNFIDLSMALRKNFHWKLLKNISTDWFVNVGPNINYWLNGKVRVGSGAFHQNYPIDFDASGQSFDKIYVKDENRWLFGLNLGVGFSAVTKRSQRINTELRLTWGQTYLGKKDSEYLAGIAGVQDELNMKCNLKVLNFSVSYIFERDIQKGRMGKSTKKVK